MVATNDANPEAPNVLYLDDSRYTSSPERREYLLARLQLGGTELLRLKTTTAGDQGRFGEADMNKLMDLLANSHVWGLNIGEFRATDEAWRIFARRLPDTWIGFVWINENGKNIGASRDVHHWLLGIGTYKTGGVLRGKGSPLSKNRRKNPSWYWSAKHGDIAPWWDGENPVFDHLMASKFLWNPMSSKHFLEK